MGEWSAARPGRTLTPGKDPVPMLHEAGWDPGPGWTGAENPIPTGIRSQTEYFQYNTLNSPNYLIVPNKLGSRPTGIT